MSTEQLTAQFGWWGLASLAVTVPWSLVHARRAAPALGWAINGRPVVVGGSRSVRWRDAGFGTGAGRRRAPSRRRKP
jgi:hypothetical protein